MVIVNGNLPAEAIRRLEKLIGKVVKVPAAKALPGALAAHPDMLIHSSPDGPVCAPEVLAALLAEGVSARAGEANPGAVYPDDVRYNCFKLNGALICNIAHTDGAILSYYRERGAEIIDCRQGYCSCSALRLPGGVITADKNVAAACEKAGVETLRISPGGIRLEGYAYGFIGGCGGMAGGKLALFGDPLTHPDGERILAFAAARGVEVAPLCDGVLTDYGGIIEI